MQRRLAPSHRGVLDAPSAFRARGRASDLVDPREGQPRRRPVLLLGSGMAVVAISAVVALEIALAIGIRTADIALQPTPRETLIVPTQPAPAPPPAGLAEALGVTPRWCGRSKFDYLLEVGFL